MLISLHRNLPLLCQCRYVFMALILSRSKYSNDGTIDDTYTAIHIQANATENRLKWCEILMTDIAE
jgi:hypothetical protein